MPSYNGQAGGAGASADECLIQEAVSGTPESKTHEPTTLPDLYSIIIPSLHSPPSPLPPEFFSAASSPEIFLLSELSEISSGYYWVRDRSELENGWTIQYFDCGEWVGYGPDEPDEVGPSVKKLKVLKMLPCPNCNEENCLEVHIDFYVRCGYCGVKGPVAQVESQDLLTRLELAVKLWNEWVSVKFF